MLTSRHTQFVSLTLLLLFNLLLGGNYQGECQAQTSTIRTKLMESNIEVKPGSKTFFTVLVTVPNGHHAYIDRGDEGFYIPIEFDFKDLEKGGYKVEVAKIPEGEREEAVKATVLREEGKFVFSIEAETTTPLSKIFRIEIQSQVCNDLTKICFPPRADSLPLPVNFVKGEGGAAKREQSAATSEAAPVRPPLYDTKEEGEGATGWLLQKYREYSKNIFLAFLFMILAGIMSAATPCVYPMLPITSAILMQRGGGDREEGIKHALFYFMGIIFVYMIMGYIAGMTGGALSTVMRSSAVNLLFAVFFVILALSMLDFYDFTFAEDLQARMHTSAHSKAGYPGTFLVGMVAGLVVSPCVGPVVFALLLQVADRIAQLNLEMTAAGKTLSFIQKSLAAGKGGVMMGGFGIGIGIPFLLVGIFSNKMPTAGKWMVYVKYALGFAILYFAFSFYMKGMGVAKVRPEVAYGILLGVGSIFSSVYLGLFKPWREEMAANEKLKKALSIILVVFGTYYFWNGLSQSGILLDVGPSTTKGEPAVTVNGDGLEKHGDLIWLRNLDSAKNQAAVENKPIFIDFHADWCANCLAFQEISLSDEELNQTLKKAVLLKVYDTDEIFKKFQEDPKYAELKTGLPFYVILNSKGEFYWKGTQYNAVQTMKKMIESASL